MAAAAGIGTVTLQAMSGDEILPQPVTLAYRDSGPASDAPVALLIHGSPGSRADYDGVAGELARRYRVIVPDLPGFGDSTRDLPDYSARAHAHYLAQLLDQLGLEQAHVVGFSMGGVVGINLYDIAPERVRSLTLLSATGVQELELFGEYRLNHSVHAFQLGMLWFAREGLPHMGLLDGAMLGVPYARNFFDTDPRPMRAVLQRCEPPVLILHGERDFLVPAAAAREHHRLLPQSRLEMVDGSHFMVFLDGEGTARRIEAFIGDVERGEAPDRARASPPRVAAAGEPFDPSSVPPFTGVALAVMMVLISVATIISEDLTCISVGLLAAQGRIDFLPGVIACFAGIFIGDMLIYLAGRYLGATALHRAPLRWLVSPAYVELSSRWFERRGPVVIGLSRFLPGTRFPTYFAAGLLRTRFWSFTLYFVIAIAVWTPLLVGISMLLGDRVLHGFESFRHFALPAVVIIGFLMLAVVNLVVPLFTFRGRRSLAGRWTRLTHWEFWPPWLFYPPVLLYVAWLMLRYRSPLLFTAANPAMPGGGFIAESKGEILRGLAGAGSRVAATRFIAAAADAVQKAAQVRRFIGDQGLSYPVVLKPDAGQRGSGVAVIRDDDQLAAYLDGAGFDLLVQEYVPGEEFGVFYCRYPDQPRGWIFSITEKRMPILRGDGVHTLEQLILLDPRAVAMARHYLRVQGDRIWQVPAEGEQVTLVELGTHCRGALFLDGSRVRTEALEAAIEEVSSTYQGFFFGRYDIRAADVDALMRGRGFKIIELNGVTSEATDIYDPRNGLFKAYRTLFEQWRIAFEIGRQNRERGARPARFREILSLLAEYRRLSRSHPD